MKKQHSTELLIAGGVLVALAVGAFYLSRPAGAPSPSTAADPVNPAPTGAWWAPTNAFSVHNSLAGYYGGFIAGLTGTPSQNPLAPRTGGYYDTSVFTQPPSAYANQVTAPIAYTTDSTSSGFTVAGSGGGTSFGVTMPAAGSGSTGGYSFGVSY